MVFSKDLKFAICFGLIIGAIISFCNLCFGAEPVDLIIMNDAQFIPSSGSTTATITTSTVRDVYYFPIESGYKYSVKNWGGFKYFGFSDSVPSVGSIVRDIDTLNANASITFTRSTSGYLYFSTTVNSGLTPISVTREPLEGMTGFIDNIAYSLSFGNLNDIWVVVVPILAISVFLGLGYYFIKRIMNKTKRAKGGV